MKECSVDDCRERATKKGLCDKHYQRQRKFGRLHNINRVYAGDKCAAAGCERVAKSLGFCQSHYGRAVTKGEIVPRDKETGGVSKRAHPLYNMWFQRKECGALGLEWVEDFWRFVRDVGPKPSKFHNLITREGTIFGPNNFEWRAQIKRMPGETKRAFYARKWQAQNEKRPGWDSDRTLKRKYGLTRAQFDVMKDAQGGVCAICKREEKSRQTHGMSTKRLAVDHCHSTGVIRGLLCWRCNVTLGKVGDSIELLEAMIVYLRRHLVCEAT